MQSIAVEFLLHLVERSCVLEVDVTLKMLCSCGGNFFSHDHVSASAGHDGVVFFRGPVVESETPCSCLGRGCGGCRGRWHVVEVAWTLVKGGIRKVGPWMWSCALLGMQVVGPEVIGEIFE